MFHEIRTYTLQPGKVPAYLKLAEEIAMPIRKDEAGVLVGWFSSEIGELNQLVHIWQWQDLAERQRQRALLRAKPGWVDVYNPQVDALVLRRQVSIMNPARPVRAPASTGHIYELRRYRTHPGKLAPWLALLLDILPLREKYSPMVGLWTSEIGEQNEAVHLWAYRDLQHRAEARRQALADPAWQEFLEQANPMLCHMRATVLTPAPFSPLK